MTQSRRTLVVVAGGIAVAVAVAIVVGVPMADARVLIGFALGAGAISGALGVAALRFTRRATIRAQAIVVALASTVAVAGGVIASASAMFLSGHDLRALLVLLPPAAAVGVAAALVLGDRVREIQLETVRLEEANQRDRAVDASRRELVAWVSHDLRTPLAAIRAMVEALEDGLVKDEETEKRYYRTLRQEADRLAGLVDDLFELSRINAGALQLQMERVVLSDLVSDALAGASPVAARRGVHLVGEPSMADAGLELIASTPEVLRVLRNLLDNAIHHTPAEGTVQVQVHVDGLDAVVTVSDACGGIPLPDLDRVFDMAFRGDAARSPAGEPGAGLGLAIARGLVEAHHGQIAVENRDNGCAFTVRLPRYVPAA